MQNDRLSRLHVSKQFSSRTGGSETVQLPARRRLKALSLAAVGVTSLLHSNLAHAATTRSWIGTAGDGSWSTATNWSGGVAPGFVGPTSNSQTDTDIAYFNIAPVSGVGAPGNPILWDNTRYIGGILFDTGAGAFALGSTSSSNLLYLNNANSITMNAGVTNAEQINGEIQMHVPSSTNGTFSFINNSSTNTATLSFGYSTFSLTCQQGRATGLTLGGTNTGNNTISSNITDNGSGSTTAITKSGAGEWVLSGTNNFGSFGCSVSAGTLVAASNSALGTNNTWTLSGGTVQIANGITLSSADTLALGTGAAIQGVGASESAGTINVSASAAATLSTSTSSDVYTVGSAANHLTGGSGAVLNIAGPGEVYLGYASNYAGQFSANAGTLELGNATALGTTTTAGFNFAASAAGVVELNGFSPTIASLNTNATVGTPVIQNSSGTAVLTVNNLTGNVYGGVLQNGGGGVLGFAKGGAGSLTLSGANTYSGGSTISAGTLAVANTSGSATGTGSVSLTGGNLTGSGTISGSIATSSGSSITPGTVTAGNAGSGVLSLATGGSTLTLAGGTAVNFGINSSTPTANYINVNNLTLPSSGKVTLDLYQPGTTTAWNAPVSNFDLFQVSGTLTSPGAYSSEFTIGTALTGLVPTYALSGGYLTLSLAAAGISTTWTNGNSTGVWNDSGNWSGGTIPNAVGAVANFLSSPGGSTINVNAPETVGGLVFNSSTSYTIATATANSLTFDNSGGGVNIAVTAGTHTISAPIILNDSLTVAPAASTALAISGGMTLAGSPPAPPSLTLNGSGTLLLSGTNGYTGGTTVEAGGTLSFAHGALGTGGININAAALQWGSSNTDDISSQTVSFLGAATLDTQGNTVTLANSIGNGGGGSLTKVGSGTLILSGSNTYTGATTVAAGVLGIASNASLGTPANGATLTIDGTTLITSATLALNNGASGTNDRPVSLVGGGTFLPAASTALTISGAITGSGPLNVGGTGGTGTVTILNPTSGQNTFSGNTVITNGATVLLGDGNSNTNGLSSGTVVLDGGTLNLRYTNSTTTQNGTFVNPLHVDAANTGTIVATNRGDISGALTGSGTLNVDVNYTRGNLDGNWSAFAGTINFYGGGNGSDVRLNQVTGFGDAVVNLTSGTSMYMILNFNVSPTTYAIGALNGVPNSSLLSQEAANSGRTLIYNIGSLNVNSEFDGTIENGTDVVTQPLALTKSGTAVLILTGTNSFSGATTIAGGTLQLGSGTFNGGISGNLGYTGGTPGAVTDNANLTFDRSNAIIQGTDFGLLGGTGSITLAGTGTTVLNEGNGFSGGAYINAGVLNINGEFALGGGAYGGATFNGGTLQYVAGLGSVSPFNGTGDITAQQSVGGVDGTAETVSIGANGGTIDTNGNSVSYANGLSGAGTLVLNDSNGTPGTLTLAGANTNSGATIVNSGTLDVTGSVVDSGTITVSSASSPATVILDSANAVSASAPVNVTGASANLLVNYAQTLASINSTGNATFTAGTSVVGQGTGVGTGTGGVSTTGGISGTGTLTVNGTANLYASHITQGVLNIGSSSTVTIADSAAPANTASVSVLTDINNSGTLDLNNNDLIVTDSAAYSTVKTLINNAADGGSWDAAGITSSSAHSNSSQYGLGYAPASAISDPTTFDGVALSGTGSETIVKYTLLGDTQLRGTVGIGDYDTVLNNFGTVQDWSGGDFHYAGTVGIGDYDDVLNNFGGTASGNLAAGRALARGLTPALSVNPSFAKADLKLEVNTVTGDVYVVANSSVGFAGYTVADPSAQLLGGSTSPDPAKLLSVSAGNGGNTNVYETAGTYVNWNKITEVANQIAEGQNNNGYANHSSRDDTVNIPSGGTIDFGDIYNTTAGVQDITFNFAEAGSNPTNGPAYYGAEVDYISASTPEPGSVSLLAVGAMGMLARRRRRLGKDAQSN